MPRMFACFLLVALSAASVGCTNYSVRAGRWELRFDDAVFVESGEEATEAIRQRQVFVLVESSGGQADEVLEILPAEASNDLHPMYADIEFGNGGSPVLKITHERDPNWIWNMYGFVRSRKFIEGTKFHARHRYMDTALEGAWSMRWLSDE